MTTTITYQDFYPGMVGIVLVLISVLLTIFVIIPAKKADELRTAKVEAVITRLDKKRESIRHYSKKTGYYYTTQFNYNVKFKFLNQEKVKNFTKSSDSYNKKVGDKIFIEYQPNNMDNFEEFSDINIPVWWIIVAVILAVGGVGAIITNIYTICKK